MTDIATLGLRVDADGAIQALGRFDDASKRAAHSGQLAEKTANSMRTALAALGVTGFAASIIRETAQAQAALAQINATVRSTGGAAGFSSGQLQEMASALQAVTRFGDEAVMAGQTRLLTYTNIQGEAFRRAQIAALDMATVLKIDVASSAELVGKALGSPIHAMGALAKQGFRFTEEQQRLIKHFAETNQMAKAQEIILGELELAYGGSARAARNTFGGALDALRNSIGDLFEANAQQTSGTVEFINTLERGVQALIRYRSEVLAATAVTASMVATFKLGPVAWAAGSAALASMSISLFSVKAAFGAAAVAGTGLKGVLVGLLPLVGGLTAVLAGVAAVLVGVGVAAWITHRNAAVAAEKAVADEAIRAARAVDDFKASLVGLSTVDIKGKMDEVKAQIQAIWASGAPALLRDTPFFTDEQRQKLSQLTQILTALTGAYVDTKRTAAQTSTEAWQKIRPALEAEIAKLKELQKVHYLDEIEIERVNLKYEALAQKRQNATELIGAELTSANRLVDARVRESRALSELRREQERVIAQREQMRLRTEELERNLNRSDRFDRVRVAPMPVINSVQLQHEIQQHVEAVRRAAEVTRQIWEEAARGVQRAFASGFERIFADGISGFRDFGKEVVNLMAGVAAQIAAAWVSQKLGLNKLLADLQAGKTPNIPAGIKYGGGAIIGGMAGYQSGSTATGLFAGAISGFALGGPVGAIIGAAGGLVGGFLGAGKAARELAEQLKKTQQAFVDNAKDYVASLKAQDRAGFDASERIRKLFDHFSKDFQLGGWKIPVGGIEDTIRWLETAAQNLSPQFRKNAQAMEAFQLILEAARLEAEKLKRAEEERLKQLAEWNQRSREDLEVRRLRALGLDAEAEAMALAIAQQREYEQAIKDGADALTLAAIEIVHAAERAARVREIMRGFDDLNREAGLSLEEARINAVILSIEQATQAEVTRLDTQIRLHEQELQVARDALRKQEQLVNETRRVVDALRKFNDELLVGSQTTLWPGAVLAENRRQFESLAAAAMGGDRAAGLALPEVARRLLDSSRGYNASGAGYVADFERVREIMSTLQGRFQNQLSVEELILETLKTQITKLEEQIAELRTSRDRAGNDAQRQIEGLRQIMDILRTTSQSTAATDSLISKLDVLRETLQGTTRDIVTAQMQSLQGTRDELQSASVRQIEAIHRGAPAHEIALLDQIRQLQLLKNDYNTQATTQIQQMAAMLGWDHEAVRAMIDTKNMQLSKFNEQIRWLDDQTGIKKSFDYLPQRIADKIHQADVAIESPLMERVAVTNDRLRQTNEWLTSVYGTLNAWLPVIAQNTQRAANESYRTAEETRLLRESKM